MTRARAWLWRLPFACAVVLGVVSFRVGLYADDYALIDEIERLAPYSPPWWDLYRFAPHDRSELLRLIEQGAFPWWTVADFKLHLFRPLTSALFTLDHALFGTAPLGYHVHSLVWYLATVAAVAL